MMKIKSVKKGWKIKMNKRGLNRYEKYKNEKLLRIGVIGNKNKGKSFLLSKISKTKLISGTNIHTEGLSIKYPDRKIMKDKNIILLDSAGFESPVLKNNDDAQEVEDEKIKEEEEEKKNEDEKDNKIEENRNRHNHNFNVIVNTRKTSDNTQNSPNQFLVRTSPKNNNVNNYKYDPIISNYNPIKKKEKNI